MIAVRPFVAAALVVVALLLQVTLFPQVAIDGVVPDVVLLVVVAAALVRGPSYAMTLGFLAGLVLDLAPPADHVAGRWAIALVVVGWLVGRVRGDAASSAVAALTTVAAASFVGTSIYALSGLVLRDPALPVAEALAVIPIAVLWDLVLAPFLLPPTMAAFRQVEPHRVRL